MTGFRKAQQAPKKERLQLCRGSGSRKVEWSLTRRFETDHPFTKDTKAKKTETLWTEKYFFHHLHRFRFSFPESRSSTERDEDRNDAVPHGAEKLGDESSGSVAHVAWTREVMDRTWVVSASTSNTRNDVVVIYAYLSIYPINSLIDSYSLVLQEL